MWTAPSCDSSQRSPYGNPLPGAGAVHHIISDQSAVLQFSESVGASGSLRDPRVNLSAERRKVDWLGQERFSTALQRPALSVGVAVRSDHDNRHVRPQSFGL